MEKLKSKRTVVISVIAIMVLGLLWWGYQAGKADALSDRAEQGIEMGQDE